MLVLVQWQKELKLQRGGDFTDDNTAAPVGSWVLILTEYENFLYEFFFMHIELLACIRSNGGLHVSLVYLSLQSNNSYPYTREHVDVDFYL
jgi:hypothetical protein